MLSNTQITQLIDAWKKIVANPGEGDDGNIIQTIFNGVFLSDASAFRPSDSILDEFKSATVVIATGDVLTLNASPVNIVPSPGATKALIPLAVESFIDYAGVAYATNTDLLFEYESGGTQIAILTAALAATADSVSYGPAVNVVDEALDQGIDVTEGGGDPATGTSPVRVTVYYIERTFL